MSIIHLKFYNYYLSIVLKLLSIYSFITIIYSVISIVLNDIFTGVSHHLQKYPKAKFLQVLFFNKEKDIQCLLFENLLKKYFVH